MLPILDDPKNYNRVIFSVDALTEGWDVLSLYDIIHFDISAAKKVSLQDIQLIGRGARLCPYKLHKSYRLNNDNLDLFDKEHGYELTSTNVSLTMRLMNTGVYLKRSCTTLLRLARFTTT